MRRGRGETGSRVETGSRDETRDPSWPSVGGGSGGRRDRARGVAGRGAHQGHAACRYVSSLAGRRATSATTPPMCEEDGWERVDGLAPRRPRATTDTPPSACPTVEAEMPPL